MIGKENEVGESPVNRVGGAAARKLRDPGDGPNKQRPSGSQVYGYEGQSAAGPLRGLAVPYREYEDLTTFGLRYLRLLRQQIACDYQKSHPACGFSHGSHAEYIYSGTDSRLLRI